MASNLHLLHRRRFVSWINVLPILRLLLDMHVSLQQYFFEINPDFVEGSVAHRNIERIIQHTETYENQEAMDMLKFMVDAKVKWTGQLDLKALFTHARYCEASDLRDKVFAFIGLGDPGYNIIPNYASSLTDVLAGTTRRIIEHENSLDILANAAASRRSLRGDLPSWVVDWTCKELGNKRDNHYGHKEFRKLSGLPHRRADVSFVSTTVSPASPKSLALAVWSSFLGTLVTEVVEDDSPQQDELFRCFETVEGRTVICSSAVRHYDQLWFLNGSRSLFVLRSIGEKYILISAAIMFSGTELPPKILKETESLQGGQQRIVIV